MGVSAESSVGGKSGIDLGARAQCLCDVSQSSLLGVANLHASDAEEATFCRGFCHFPADAAQPSPEGSFIARCLRMEDCRDLPQIGERALNDFGRLGSGKALTQRLLATAVSV